MKPHSTTVYSDSYTNFKLRVDAPPGGATQSARKSFLSTSVLHPRNGLVRTSYPHHTHQLNRAVDRGPVSYRSSRKASQQDGRRTSLAFEQSGLLIQSRRQFRPSSAPARARQIGPASSGGTEARKLTGVGIRSGTEQGKPDDYYSDSCPRMENFRSMPFWEVL